MQVKYYEVRKKQEKYMVAKEALEYYVKAAKLGGADGQGTNFDLLWLGLVQLWGVDQGVDEDGARRLLEPLAETGMPLAMHVMSVLRPQGAGTGAGAGAGAGTSVSGTELSDSLPALTSGAEVKNVPFRKEKTVKIQFLQDIESLLKDDASITRLVVHLQRHLLNKVRPRDKEAFAYDLKAAFNHFEKDSTKEKALELLKELVERWRSHYGAMLDKLIEENYILDYLSYIDYPVEVRRMIYTTNSLENVNRQIRKVTKTKVTFDKESNLLDLVFMVIKDFEANNWQKYPVTAYQFWPKNTQPL